MSTLVIVESPTKARTIRNFLPSNYRVEASMGHVRDLPSSAEEIPEAVKGEKWAQLGVNVDADFEPLYVIPKDKKKIVKELKDALKQLGVPALDRPPLFGVFHQHAQFVGGVDRVFGEIGRAHV